MNDTKILRITCAALLWCAGLAPLPAEAPELRNVMPNSWRKVTRLTADEEAAFAREHAAVMENINFSMARWKRERGDDFKYSFVYIQKAGEDVFYRVLCVENETPDFLSPSMRFSQFLIYNGRILHGWGYNYIIIGQRFSFRVFYSIDVIGTGKAKGVMVTSLSVKSSGDGYSRDAYRKGQLYGSLDCYYRLMKDIVEKGSDAPAIRITSSDCLVDPNIPLRYSIQNAFDGDPATSYVSNSADEIMNIGIGIVDPARYRKCAIINGYAQNMTLYKNNNRIRSL